MNESYLVILGFGILMLLVPSVRGDRKWQTSRALLAAIALATGIRSSAERPPANAEAEVQQARQVINAAWPGTGSHA
ncbi:hypothetical protein [Bradyrhizobium viridifuturi]|uniref:hypothetical protein n=1 Tax=Bradyrhizobium viridifuturi TaxID=1654716 RepID=UPI000FE1453B|nr:hypothetical protein [Bradyrhizobium viridifuturi]